jgi:hypothetical protein
MPCCARRQFRFDSRCKRPRPLFSQTFLFARPELCARVIRAIDYWLHGRHRFMQGLKTFDDFSLRCHTQFFTRD